MFKVACETLIRARPETVYGLLADVARYSEWNPWNIRGEGTAAPGQVITITAKLGKREMKVNHRILVMEPNQRFVWCDLGWFTMLAYGERARYLSRNGDGVHYRVELTITGPLAWLVKWQMLRALETGMQAETDALKRVAEARG
jgi:hypothetical protein